MTRVIPGLVVLSPILFELYLYQSTVIDDIGVGLLLLAIAALIVGELIDHLRSGIYRVPLPFSYAIYQETNDKSHLPTWYRKVESIDRWLPNQISLIHEVDENNSLKARLNFDFLDELLQRYELNQDLASPRDYFDILTLSLNDDISPLTVKFKNSFIFNQNFKISSFFAGIILVYLLIISVNEPIMPIYFLLIILLFMFTYAITTILNDSSHMYAEMLIKEFYIKCENEDS